MIENKFSILLAKKLVKISKISKESGISRVTLTNLYYRRTQQIDLKTMDKLCCYLQCSVSDIFEFKENNKKEAVVK